MSSCRQEFSQRPRGGGSNAACSPATGVVGARCPLSALQSLHLTLPADTCLRMYVLVLLLELSRCLSLMQAKRCVNQGPCKTVGLAGFSSCMARSSSRAVRWTQRASQSTDIPRTKEERGALGKKQARGAPEAPAPLADHPGGLAVRHLPSPRPDKTAAEPSWEAFGACHSIVMLGGCVYVLPPLPLSYRAGPVDPE